MIGGVLVERTVGETLPAVEGNSKQIGQIVTMLKSQLEKQSKLLEDFKTANGIKQQPRGGQSQARAESDGGAAKTSGVLV